MDSVVLNVKFKNERQPTNYDKKDAMRNRRFHNATIAVISISAALICFSASADSFHVNFVSLEQLEQLNVNMGNPRSALLRPEDEASNVDLSSIAKIIASADLPFRYRAGGCANRSHALSAILAEHSIPHAKIWAFAPSIVDAGRAEMILVSSAVPGATDSRISWAYHVAISVRSGGKYFVLDPAISEKPLSPEQWRDAIGCADCVFARTGKQYNDYAVSSVTMAGPVFEDLRGNKIVRSAPKSMFSGRFWVCSESPCQSERWVTNDVALNVAGEVLIKALMEPSTDGVDSEVIRSTLLSYELLVKTLKDPIPPRNKVLALAWKEYRDAQVKWESRLKNAYWTK